MGIPFLAARGSPCTYRKGKNELPSHNGEGRLYLGNFCAGSFRGRGGVERREKAKSLERATP